MITEKRVCDICKREIKWHANFFEFKVKSLSFINYANEGLLGSNVRQFDLCQDCLDEIANMVNGKEKEND